MSRWMEDAAWRKIRALGGIEDLPLPASSPDRPPEQPDPLPTYRWSPLFPDEFTEQA